MEKFDCQECMWSVPFGPDADQCVKYKKGRKPMQVVRELADCSNFLRDIARSQEGDDE